MMVHWINFCWYNTWHRLMQSRFRNRRNTIKYCFILKTFLCRTAAHLYFHSNGKRKTYIYVYVDYISWMGCHCRDSWTLHTAASTLKCSANQISFAPWCGIGGFWWVISHRWCNLVGNSNPDDHMHVTSVSAAHGNVAWIIKYTVYLNRSESESRKGNQNRFLQTEAIGLILRCFLPQCSNISP